MTRKERRRAEAKIEDVRRKIEQYVRAEQARGEARLRERFEPIFLETVLALEWWPPSAMEPHP